MIMDYEDDMARLGMARSKVRAEMDVEDSEATKLSESEVQKSAEYIFSLKETG